MSLPKLSKSDLRDLVQKAVDAAKVAHANAVPAPMRVVQRANPLDDNSAVVRDYGIISDGVCGFAWVIVRPGNSALAKYLVSIGMGRKSYEGGIRVSMSGMFASQSMERGYAAACAFAKVLNDAGFERVYPDSRID